MIGAPRAYARYSNAAELLVAAPPRGACVRDTEPDVGVGTPAATELGITRVRRSKVEHCEAHRWHVDEAVGAHSEVVTARLGRMIGAPPPG